MQRCEGGTARAAYRVHGQCKYIVQECNAVREALQGLLTEYMDNVSTSLRTNTLKTDTPKTNTDKTDTRTVMGQPRQNRHSSSVFSIFVVGTSSFHSPRSPILLFFYLYSFLLNVFSYNIIPPQFGLSIFLGENLLPSSVLSLLHLPLSFSPHVTKVTC